MPQGRDEEEGAGQSGRTRRETGDDWWLRFGIEVATVLQNAGGLEELATEYEELSAHHGNNYLPLLDRFLGCLALASHRLV